MRQFTSILIIIFLQFQLGLSQVWPGDVNNNGVVNNIDLLYIGNAYGTTGPKRINATTNWEAQEISSEWNNFFTGNINFAHADCNGDGIIDALDFIVVYSNYNKTHGIPEDDFTIGGIPNVDPQLQLNSQDSLIVKEGQAFSIPISLGNDSLQIDNFNGIAFSIYFSPDIVNGASIQFNIDNSWIDTGNIFSVVQNDIENGVVDVAVTHYGQHPVSGSGQIGTLDVIIEDHILPIAMVQQLDTITIDSIRMVDEFLNTTAIANDTIIYIIQKDTTTQVKNIELNNPIQINPNPADKILNINAKVEIQSIEIYNMLGDLVFKDDLYNNSSHIQVKPFINGIYIVQLFTNKGVISKKVLIRH